jgi:hypothetical protein
MGTQSCLLGETSYSYFMIQRFARGWAVFGACSPAARIARNLLIVRGLLAFSSHSIELGEWIPSRASWCICSGLEVVIPITLFSAMMSELACFCLRISLSRSIPKGIAKSKVSWNSVRRAALLGPARNGLLPESFFVFSKKQRAMTFGPSRVFFVEF